MNKVVIVVLLIAKLNYQETIHHIEAAFFLVFNVQIALALDGTILGPAL